MWIYVPRRVAIVSDCTGVRVENDIRLARYKHCKYGYLIYVHLTCTTLHVLCTPFEARR